MDLGIAERTYVLTGSSSGLGRASAEALVAEGANVVVSSRDADRVAAAAAALGERAHGVAVANSDPGAPEKLISAALERFGRLDGALISVGGPPTGKVT